MPSSTALAHGAPDRSNAASGDASSDDSEDDDIDALLMQACSAGSEDVASTLLRHGASKIDIELQEHVAPKYWVFMFI